MTRRASKKTRGYTLVEVLVACTIVAMIQTAAVLIFTSLLGRSDASSNRITLDTRIKLQRGVRETVIKLFYKLQESLEIIRPLPGETRDSIYFRDRVSKVLLCKKDATDHPGIFTVRTYQVNKTGKIITDEDPVEIENIRSITFTPHSTQSVLIHLTVAAVDKDGELTSDLSLVTLIRLRSSYTPGDLMEGW